MVATKIAMIQAVSKLSVKPEHLLIDAMVLDFLLHRQKLFTEMLVQPRLRQLQLLLK